MGKGSPSRFFAKNNFCVYRKFRSASANSRERPKANNAFGEQTQTKAFAKRLLWICLSEKTNPHKQSNCKFANFFWFFSCFAQEKNTPFPVGKRSFFDLFPVRFCRLFGFVITVCIKSFIFQIIGQILLRHIMIRIDMRIFIILSFF